MFSLVSFLSVYCVWVSSQDICEICHCEEYEVDCSHTNLTYIPELPQNTTIFNFKYNKLPKIDNQTFKNLTNLQLKFLALNGNEIRIVESGSFANLKYLRNLSLDTNPLTNQSLYNLIPDFENRHLPHLALNSIGIKEIPPRLFPSELNLTIDVLTLTSESLIHVNFSQFESLQLKDLTLSHNKLRSVSFARLPELQSLSLSSNSFSELPNFCEENFFPSLRLISLKKNKIDKYIPNYLSCLKNLRILNMHRNSLLKIVSNSFRDLPSLSEIDLSVQKNPTSRLCIDKYAFNGSHVTDLVIYDSLLNPFSTDDLAFKGCHKLRYLNLGNNQLCFPFYANTQCKKLNTLLSYLPSLHILNLKEMKLAQVPEVFRYLPHLVEINLNHNQILTWSGSIWDNNKKLIHFYMPHNTIKIITKEMFPVWLRNQLKTISLSQNPLECVCDNVWFIEWVKRNRSVFLHEYPCLNMTERVCLLQYTEVYSSISGVSCIVFLLVIVISIIYKNRWFLKYQIYIWRHQPRIIRDMARRQYVYDVFVSYSGDDSDWVLDHLVPNLENDENLKLCIHQRDFQAGRMIIDNIVESIENSRCVLIVLSNNFAKSEWCQFELTLAQKHVLNAYIEPLTVVLLEDIDAENTTNSLYALLKTTTYISWNDEQNHLDLFWDRLKRSLRHRDID